MGRELKRVPLDFDYPLHKVWYGYFVDNISFCISSQNEEYCENCKEFARIKGMIQNSMDALNLMSISNKLRIN